MARKSPTVDVAPWSRKALRTSLPTRFNFCVASFGLASLAHCLAQRRLNFLFNLTGAAAESGATNVVLESGSAAGPGFSDTPVLEQMPLRIVSGFPTHGIL